MEANNYNRTIALAALFQAVDGVIQIANTGRVDADLMQTAINSILMEDAQDAEALYGSLDKLKNGFKSMLFQLGSGQLMPDGKPKDMEATRYALGLLHLEKKLAKDPQLFAKLLDEISSTQKKLDFFEGDHSNIINSLANTYATTISTITPKILVRGDQNHLSNPDNAAKIRTLLLAGIRAALLWRQAGGDRWKLLLQRGKLQRQAEQFLKQY